MRPVVSLATLPYDLARELGEVAAAGLIQSFTWTLRHRATSLEATEGVIGSRRTPVVLVHGYGGNEFNWRPLKKQGRVKVGEVAG